MVLRKIVFKFAAVDIVVLTLLSFIYYNGIICTLCSSPEKGQCQCHICLRIIQLHHEYTKSQLLWLQTLIYMYKNI